MHCLVKFLFSVLSSNFYSLNGRCKPREAISERFKMEYKEIFIVQGKYGCHVGPDCEIAEIVMNEQEEFNEKGRDFEVKITKIYCPERFREGKTADAYWPAELMSLHMIDGSRLEVLATLTPEEDSERDKEKLKQVVNHIGEIITNIDRYTVRRHR